MPDRPAPAEALDRITADALALRRALRTNATNHAHALAALITDAQDLAGTTLWLFLDLAQHTPRTSADLLLLDRVAQIAPRPALDRRTAASAATGNVRPVATPGTHSRRTGRKPKYVQYE
ncbi:hypothetical protein ABZ656_11430, partial [Streptomyces sp. NPDC007095]|uniref:hypothetical protein n=1 Tax=Streptomyces sp. NPDC007095 TaxID=3154482 RepID=UPI0033CA8FCB